MNFPVSCLLSVAMASAVGPSANAQSRTSTTPDDVCVVLSTDASSTGARTILVGFGMKRNDYFFSGVAEVAQNNELPKADPKNRVIYTAQSIRRLNAEGLQYVGPDEGGGIRLKLTADRKGGSFWADSSTSARIPKPRALRVEGAIRRVLPLKSCLSDAQTSLCILAGAGC